MLLVLLGLTVSACGPTTTVNQSDSEYFHVAGALQHNAITGDWELVQDGEHEPMNVDRIEVLADRIEIHYAQTASKVVSLSLDPDDSFSRAGFFVGASVGQAKFVIFLSQLLGGVVVPRTPGQAIADGGESILFIGLFKK